MSEQKVQQLLVLAVKSVKAGDKDKGRQAFLAAIKLDPDNETAWMGLVGVAKDNRERLTALKKTLMINPNNTRALAVLSKLGITPERLLGVSADTPAEDETPPEADAFDEPISTLESASFVEDGSQPNQPSAFVTETDDEPFSDSDLEPVPDIQSEPRASVFDSPPPILGTDAGVPTVDPQALGRITQDVENIVNEYLNDSYQFENITWVRKTKRRAGEADIWKWRAQVFGVITLVLLLFGGVPAVLFLTSPEGQRVVQAPTHTITPTFTFTPSHTPGITPTPSPEPLRTFTPTPTFFLQGIQGELDLNLSPAPTTVYSPGSILVGPRILDAWQMIRDGEYTEAFELLEEEKLSNDTGYPYPYYLQAQIDLAQDDPEKAREKLDEGEALLEEIQAQDAIGFVPLYTLGQGEVLFYEALQAQADQTGNANTLFNQAEEQFREAIALDGRMTEAYVQLARLLVAREEYQEAINLLNVPIEGELSNEFFTDILLRVERGRVYFVQGSYDRALQEANEALFFEPWSEEAYILQAESALAMERPGLANSYLDGYQLVYPDSLLAFKLEGDAYRLEGKADQALLAYNIALQDNEDHPDYLTVLEARGDLYFEQRRFDLAQANYTNYLDEQDNDTIRVKRMWAAYNAGDYEVALRDARQLEDSGELSNGDLMLLQGQILTDTAETTTDYNEALDSLSEAVVTFGVSEENRGIAEDYLARVNFELGNIEQALLNIDRAIAEGETGSRYYLRGQILQEQANYEDARQAYEFVLAWGQIFPYPFLEDTQDRYDEVVELINNPPEEEDDT